MEEDVEIELLLKSNEEILMLEASRLGGDENQKENESEQNISIISEDDNRTSYHEQTSNNKSNKEKKEEVTSIIQEPSKETTSLDLNEEVNYSGEVQELIEDSIVSYMAKEPSKHAPQLLHSVSTYENDITENESDKRHQFINEICSQSEQYGGSLMEKVKRILGNKNLQVDYTPLHELASAHSLIIERTKLLESLEHKFQEKLYLVEENIQIVRESISSLSDKADGNKLKQPSFTKSFFKSFGAPYFKDNSGFAAPPNVDHAIKLKTGQTTVNYIEHPCYWTKDHQKRLVDAIKETLAKEKTDHLIRQINKIKGIIDNSSEKISYKELHSKLEKCQQELVKIKDKSFEELISRENQDREYDWMKYSASIFDGEHSPDECKRFWEVYLKPTRNKSNWEYAEDSRLLDIAKQMNSHDWSSIAKQLGTNRSDYQCFVHFQTRLNERNHFSKGKWSKEEDERLMSIINSSRVGNFIPWTKVSSHMGERNHIQIYNRFKNCLDPKLIKGRFTKGEDLLIVAGIEVFGCNYKELSSLLNNRSSNQLRERYERFLLPKSSKLGTWTVEEDKQLIQLVEKYGEQNWVAVSKEMKFRSRTQVRQRYRSIQQNIKNKADWTITKFKRRNIPISVKRSERTKKSVERIKKEIDKVEQSFKLSKIEKETFRIEKLIELREKILMQTYKLKPKKRNSGDCTLVNTRLEELFKHNQIKPPISTKICDRSEYEGYCNELLFLAKNLGHELQIPDNDCEILNNPRLSNILKHVLLESKKIKQIDLSIMPSNASCSSIPSNTNIDYIPPESDTTIIHDSWFNPMRVTPHLNFSEIFKPTIFDYKSGMHRDIWYSKLKQSAQINSWQSKLRQSSQVSSSFANKPHEQPTINKQLYNIPPNLITTLGFKSLLLSRTRLKHDCKRGIDESFSQESESNCSTNCNIDVNTCLDDFQETMLTLFTWPRALSLCDMADFEFKTSSKKASQLQQKSSKNSSVNLINKSENSHLPGLKKINSDKKRKLNEPNLERLVHLKQLKISRNIACKRKIKIEHLLPNKKKETITSVSTNTLSKRAPSAKLDKNKKTNDENKSPISYFNSKGLEQLGSKSGESANLSLKSMPKTYGRQHKRKAEPTSMHEENKKMYIENDSKNHFKVE